MKNVILLTVSFLLTLVCIPAKAQFFWMGNGGNWSDPANWFDASISDVAVAPPADNDEVWFVGGFGFDCNIDVNLNTRTSSIFIDESYGSVITNSGGFSVAGDVLSMKGGTFNNSGGTTFNFGIITIDGGALQLGTTSSAVIGDFEINSGSFNGGNADVTISGLLSLNSGSTFTSTTDTLRFTSSSSNLISFNGGTFTHNGGSVILNVNDGNKQISSGLTFGNLILKNTSSSAYTLNIGSGNTTVTGTLIMNVSNASGLISLTGNGNINLAGNLNVTLHIGTGIPSHTSTITFNGSSGTSTITAGTFPAALGRAKLPSIIVNQSGTATLALVGQMIVAGNWTYNGSTGVTPGTSTVAINGASRTIGGSGVMTFNNLGIGTGTGVGTASVSLSNAVTINGTLTVPNTCTFTATGHNISIGGATTISSGGTFTTSNNTVSLGGNFSNQGTFNPNNTVFNIIGSTNPTLDFRNAGTVTLHTLNCAKSSGTATISDDIRISNLLTCTGGTLNTNGRVTLLSTAAGTSAQVGNSTGGTFTGAATIQRFIPAKATRKWHFLAAPALTAQTLANSWQTQIYVTGPGTGTGPVSNSNYNSNGFDWTAAGSPSIYTYNENQVVDFNSRWEAFPNTSTALAAGTGYRVFIRGERGPSNAGQLDGSITNQSSVTLAVSGTIPRGDQNVSISCSNGCTSNDGWNLVGNPYPATIDWNTFQAAGANSGVIAPVYYVLDAASNPSAYVSWDGDEGGAGRFISSGQAFWVKKVTSGSSNITFSETHKSIANSGGAFFKTGTISNSLKITLNGATTSNSAYARLSSKGQYELDPYDAHKLSFGNYMVATFNPENNVRLDINNLPAFGAKTIDTVEVDVKLPVTAANYSLVFGNLTSFDQAFELVLEDKLTNTFTDLRTTQEYNFATNGTNGSTGNRFRILISNTSNPLPVDFMVLQGKLNGKMIDLTWSTVKEVNNEKFVVEHSADGRSFKAVGELKGAGNSSVKTDYLFTHRKPLANGINYYRVKQVDFNGRYTYSNVCFVAGSRSLNTDPGTDVVKEPAALTVYPVPAGNQITISGLRSSSVKISVFGVYGDRVLSEEVPNVEAGKTGLNIEALKPGVYIIEITGENGETERLKFSKQ